MTAAEHLQVPNEPGEETLAGLWSFALQSLAARAAHEINNALNGAIMNVEVVKARARPGADAGAAATFAEAAADQLDLSARLVTPLLALARPHRGTLDVASVARDAVALLAPAAAHHGLQVEIDGASACAVGGDPTAVRLAVVASLLALSEPGLGGSTDETAGMEPADEPVVRLRCTTHADRPEIAVGPRRGATLGPAYVRALHAAGVHVVTEPEQLRLIFPRLP